MVYWKLKLQNSSRTSKCAMYQLYINFTLLSIFLRLRLGFHWKLERKPKSEKYQKRNSEMESLQCCLVWVARMNDDTS